MSRPLAAMPAAVTFVVRFWREWTGASSRWRGRIEHVQSGRRRDFLYMDDMLGFLDEAGITLARPAAGDCDHTLSKTQEEGSP